jgi:hypothetical protein
VAKGKTECLLYIKAENSSCRVSVYDFTIYNRGTNSGAGHISPDADFIPAGPSAWKREDETAVYKAAAGNNKRSLSMLERIHDCVQKLQEALTKRLKSE